MKKHILLFLIPTLCDLTVISAQIFNSFLYPLPDTAYVQVFTPRIHDNRIIVLNATYELGFSGAQFIAYIDEYGLDGSRMSHQLLDPALPQAQQVVNNQTILWVGDRLMVCTDKLVTAGVQNAMIFGLTPDLSNAWVQEFTPPGVLSTSGILLPSGPDHALHVNIQTAEIGYYDSLAIRLLSKDGQVAWTRHAPLPMDSQRDYIRVMSGAKLNDKIIVMTTYGIPNAPNSKYHLSIIDTLGNVLEEKNYPVSYPVVAFQPANDTFYVAESESTGSTAYYCLHTYAGSINNEVNIACTNIVQEEVSDGIFGTRIDPKGNIYVVGNSYLDPKLMGHIAKFSPKGELLWKKNYQLDAYPNGGYAFSGIDFMDNGLLLTGALNNDIAAPSFAFHWLLRLDEDGCFENNCDDLVIVPGTVVGTKYAVNPDKPLIHAFPNPADNQLHIQYVLDADREYVFSVVNLMGQTVFSKNLEPASQETTIPVHQLPNGAYMYRLTSQDGTYDVGKIIIAH